MNKLVRSHARRPPSSSTRRPDLLAEAGRIPMVLMILIIVIVLIV